MKNEDRLKLRNKFCQLYNPYTSKEEKLFNAFKCALQAGYTYGTSRNITKTIWFKQTCIPVRSEFIRKRESEFIKMVRHNFEMASIYGVPRK
jgi:hypothetical protein